MIANHIRSHQAEKMRKDYTVYFVPRRNMICENLLKSEGVYESIRNIGEFHMDIIPFESDVLSMELPLVLKENLLVSFSLAVHAPCAHHCTQDGDRSSLFYVAKALMRLQTTFGVIPKIIGKGQMSKVFAFALALHV